MSNLVSTRFAPTPNGPLHQGSLVAALASYLFVKSFPVPGAWRLRIDDLDELRVDRRWGDRILRQLELLGLFWDGPIVFQSKQQAAYQSALEDLHRRDLLFHCTCSRKLLESASIPKNAWGERIYPGFCENRNFEGDGQSSLRLRLNRIAPEGAVRFKDLCAGERCIDVRVDWGFPILRRSDGVVAYHLANVVDDQSMGITHVIRGVDLLGASFVHLSLARALGYSEPQYGHVALLVDEKGQKLGKSTGAFPIARDSQSAVEELRSAISDLGITCPSKKLGSTRELLEWAVKICRETRAQIERSPNRLWFSKSLEAEGNPIAKRD